MKKIEYDPTSMRATSSDRAEHGSLADEKIAKRNHTTITLKSPLVVKIAKANIQDTELWVDVYAFRRVDGQTCHAAMLSSLASRPSEVLKLLANLGLHGTTEPTIRNVISAAVNSSTARLGTILIRGGWIGVAGHQFALPDHIVRGKNCPEPDLEYFLAPDFDLHRPAQLVSKDGTTNSSHLTLARKGTTKKWKQTVASLAMNSSSMMLAISASLAAPFLRLMNETPFSIVLTGHSTGGKTTETLASASVIGIGRELDLANWNMTAAGLEQRAEIHSDICLHIDDIKNFSGSDKEAYKLIKEVAYRITSGAKKTTQTRAKTGITGRPAPSAVSTIVLTSSELSLDELARKTGDTVPDGVRVRFLEIPIADRSLGGIFDLHSVRGSDAKRTKACAKLAKSISEACSKNHGAIFRKLLKAITRDPNAAVHNVKRYVEQFIGAVDIDRNDALHLRHSRRFAFLFGCAAFAIDEKLLPWTHEQLLLAILKCHAVSRTKLSHPLADKTKASLEEGLAKLKIVLRDKKRIATSPAAVADGDAIGWKVTRGSRRLYYVTGTAWRRTFSSRAQQHQVEAYLIKQRILRSGASGSITVQPKIGSSGKRASRCYELSFSAKGATKRSVNCAKRK